MDRVLKVTMGGPPNAELTIHRNIPRPFHSRDCVVIMKEGR
jgi:hypothetical protein